MTARTPNAQYNIAAPEGLAVRLAAYQRRRMFDRFLSETDLGPDDRILDIGATSDRTYSSSNYLEAWWPHKDRITAVGVDDASFLEALYPGLTFVQASGLALPFEDQSFEVVHSSAVLEHVGGFDNQVRFIAECMRVARRAVFLTTPNRWFPVEMHTLLPVLHWLPKPTFRACLRRMNLDFFSEEANLNLMSSGELRRAVGLTPQTAVFRSRISNVRLGGWPSNLLVIAVRTGLGVGERSS